MVLDKQGKLLYSSALMRLLSGDDQTALLRYVLQLAEADGLDVPGVKVSVRNDSLRLFAVVDRESRRARTFASSRRCRRTSPSFRRNCSSGR